MSIPIYSRARFLLCVCAVAWLLVAQEAKTVAVFGPQGPFSVAVRDRNGREYVALLDVLQRVGATAGKADGKKFVVGYEGAELGFIDGKSKAKVRGKSVEMGAPAVIEDNVLLVPVRGLSPLLTRLLEQPVEWREPGRRLLLVTPTAFQSELSANPSRLVLHFSRAVSPIVASEPGRLRLTFANDPVEAPEAAQSFPDKLITSAAYTEASGNAVLTVSGSAPLMAAFSDEGRTVTIAAAPQPVAPKPAAAPAQVVATPPTTTAAPPVPGQASASDAQTRPRFLVVIDPAHGGEDRGALLASGMDEKNVTLALARRLKSALETAGIPVLLLRDGDTNLTADQRAAAANSAHASVFISIHAGSIGHGLRTYTARMSATATPAATMLPWDTAQAGLLDSSRELAAAIDAQLEHASIDHADEAAQVQPLPHITSAAITLEYLPGDRGVASLMSADYQQKTCAAVAQGIVASRRVLEARK